jgi:hypothetical protein
MIVSKRYERTQIYHKKVIRDQLEESKNSLHHFSLFFFELVSFVRNKSKVDEAEHTTFLGCCTTSPFITHKQSSQGASSVF